VFPVVALTSQLSKQENHQKSMGKVGSWERAEASRGQTDESPPLHLSQSSSHEKVIQETEEREVRSRIQPSIFILVTLVRTELVAI
jgi:hypothetical protein